MTDTKKRLTPVKSIKAYCYERSGWSNNEVRLCQITTCQLYQYRLGKNPACKREPTGSIPESLKAWHETKRRLRPLNSD